MASVSTPSVGLRERKKIKTRRAIRRAARLLFEQQGYEATTVEQIAEAAEISPSTFFRYFPAKEDVLLGDGYEPLVEAALRDRPAGEPLAESVRQALLQQLRLQLAQDPEETLQFLRIAQRVPAVRNRMAGTSAAAGRSLARVVAERAGRPADDLQTRLLVSAFLAAWHEALLDWAETGSHEELPDLLDRTLALLTDALRG
ncbi:TetR family transcriptional regulator [Streptomyces sp. NPDC059637]|uniref:TetR family transcriptional regulator n=1 Tax=Streptomyces sp. NPDC059637 TaxID=3347752 RepID=UPI0036837329